jgi:hypothetical protein
MFVAMPKAPTRSNNPIFQQSANSACGCTKMVINVAIRVGNMCLSRRWKADQVIFISCIQMPGSFMHLVP